MGLLGTFASRGRQKNPGKLVGGVVLVACALLSGGYTYLRNALSVGNPLFPLPLLGLPGWREVTLAFRSAGPEYPIEPWRFLTARLDLFGRLFAITALPAAIVAPLMAVLRRKGSELLVFLLPGAFFVEFLLLSHDHRHLRYFMAGVALAGVGFVWVVERLSPKAGGIVRLAVIGATIGWKLVSLTRTAPSGDSLMALGVAAVAILPIALASSRPWSWWMPDLPAPAY